MNKKLVKFNQNVYSVFILPKPKLLGRLYIILSGIFIYAGTSESMWYLLVWIISFYLGWIYIGIDYIEHEFDNTIPFSPCINCGKEEMITKSKYCIYKG